MPEMRLAALAGELGLEVDDGADVRIIGVASVDDAGPGELTYVRSEAFAAQLAESGASAVIASPGLDVGTLPVIRSKDPSRDFYRATALLMPRSRPAAGIHASAVVDETAEIDPSASIGPCCVIGTGVRVGPRSVLRAGVALYDGVRVGADCELHARVVVAAASVLGDRVILHPGVVIGGEGFGYVGDAEGGLQRVHNIGRVLIEDEVEIGANSTVDRGTLGDTRVGRGSKIDNLVQIGHNCRIGERVVLIAQVGIAGSTVVEDDAVIMAQSGVAGHLRIGKKTFIGARAGITKNIPDGESAFGFPQRDGRSFHRESAALRRLPELLRRVRALERATGGSGDEE